VRLICDLDRRLIPSQWIYEGVGSWEIAGATLRLIARHTTCTAKQFLKKPIVGLVTEANLWDYTSMISALNGDNFNVFFH